MTMFPTPADLLPHRDFMLLIDEIKAYQPEHSLIAIKTIRDSEDYLRGHFPGYPLVPGVLLVEMMYQTAGLFIRMEAEQASNQRKLGKAVSIKNALFKKEVKPGDQLQINVELINRFFNFFTFKSYIARNTEICAEAEIVVGF